MVSNATMREDRGRRGRRGRGLKARDKKRHAVYMFQEVDTSHRGHVGPVGLTNQKVSYARQLAPY